MSSCVRDEEEATIVENKTGRTMEIHEIGCDMTDTFFPDETKWYTIGGQSIVSLPTIVRFPDTGYEFEYFNPYYGEDVKMPPYRTPGHFGYYKWSKDGRIRTYTFTEQDYDWIVMMNNAGIYSDKDLVFEE